MARYVFLLLLVNSYYSILANPLPSNITLADYLTKLGERCVHPFLATQIKSKIEDCNSTFIAPYDEKQLRCLMFYDINSRLCSATQTKGKLNFTTELNEVQNITSFCDHTKNLTFTNLTNYPKYQAALQFAANNPSSCTKLCLDNIASVETNFFCKYYKLGFDILKDKDVPISTSLSYDRIGNGTSVKTDGIAAEVSSSVNIGNPTSHRSSGSSGGTVGNIASSVNIGNPTSHRSSGSSGGTVGNIASPVNIGNLTLHKQAINNNEVEQDLNEKPNQLDNPNAVDENGLNEETDLDSEGSKDDQFDAQADDNEEPDVNNPKKAQENKVNTMDAMDPSFPKDNPQTGGDSEASKNDPLDPQIDGDGDTDVNYPKKAQDKSKLSRMDAMDSSFPRDISHKDYSVPNEYADEDDNFFPFFLASVILVVLLYVLYHNKSKVSKVILGLIVEGRQSGRRRNSRGHSYRRLDTLEQAMSASTAATPSKIIY